MGRLIAFVAALVFATLAGAQLIDVEGTLGSATLGGTKQAQTVVEDLKLTIGAPLMLPAQADAAQRYDTDGVLFVPLGPGTQARSWTFTILNGAPTLRGRVAAVQLPTDEAGRIRKIESLSAVSLDATQPGHIALPTGATHLEIAVSEPTQLAFVPTPELGAKPDGPVRPGEWVRPPAGPRVTLEAPIAALGTGEDLQQARLSVALPQNYAGEVIYHYPTARITLPLTGTPATTRAPNIEAALERVEVVYQRDEGFGADPWPTFAMRLDHAPVDSDEKEPNDTFETAQPLNWPAGKKRHRVSGIGTRSSPDLWALEVTETRAGAGLLISADFGDLTGELSLLSPDGQVLARRTGTGKSELSDLVLPVGQYAVAIAVRDQVAPYTLRTKMRKPPRSNEESEPNDLIARASLLPLGQAISGSVPAGDEDHFRFTITDSEQLYTLQAAGGPELSLLLGNGEQVLHTPANREGRLTQLSGLRLPAGTYFVRLRGAESYRLELLETGAAPTDFEEEPNARAFEAMHLKLGQSVRGIFNTKGETDGIRFELDAPQHVRIQISAPDDSQLRAVLNYGGVPVLDHWNYAPGSSSDQTFFLHPGAYHLALTHLGTDQSRDAWRVALQPPQAAQITEPEPNARTPISLRAGNWVTGHVGGLDPRDSFLIDLPAQPGEIFYHCLQPEHADVETGLLVGQDDPAQARLRGAGVPPEGLSMAHQGTAGTRFMISHRPRPDGPNLYRCAPRWKTPETLRQQLQTPAPRVTAHYRAAGIDPADRLPVPVNLTVNVTAPEQTLIRRIDFASDVTAIAARCSDAQGHVHTGRLHLFDEAGQFARITQEADGVRVFEGAMTTGFVRIEAQSIAPGQSLSCALWPATGDRTPPQGPTMALTAEVPWETTDSPVRLKTAALPGRLWQPLRIDFGGAGLFSADCGPDTANELRERRFGAPPMHPRLELRAHPDTQHAREMACDLYDLTQLPLLPLRDAPASLPPVLNMATPVAPFAAFADLSQAQEIGLTVTNPNDHPLNTTLMPQVSARSWTIGDGPVDLTLAPGESRALSFSLSAPPYLGANEDAAIHFTAEGPSFALQELRVPLKTTQRGAPVGARPYWPVPEQMIGGLNVAWHALGGRVWAVNDARLPEDQQHLPLIDRNAPRVQPHFIDHAQSLTLDLAGQTPVPLAGFVYTMRPQAMPLDRIPRKLRIEQSQDGQVFQDIGLFDLEITPTRQFLTFPSGVAAQYLRLSNPDCADQRHCLYASEVAVIAQPDWSPTPEGVNLADPTLGGLVIGSNTPGGTNVEALQTGSERLTLLPPELGPEETPPDYVGSMVLGFFKARAAQVQRISWLRPTPYDDEVPYVDIAIGNRPTGRGQFVGRMMRPEPGQVSDLILPPGTRARYVFVHLPYSPDRQAAPAQIQVIETPHSSAYRSILGIWPEDDRRSYHDWIARNVPPVSDALPAPLGGAFGAGQLLPANQTLRSATRKEDAPDWYHLAAQPDAARTMLRVITLSAPRIVEVGLRLYDADHTEIPLTPLGAFVQERPDLKQVLDGLMAQTAAVEGDHISYVAQVDPRRDHFLKVHEEGRLLILRREMSSMLELAEPTRRRAYQELANMMGDGQDALSIGVPGRSGQALLKGRDEIMFALSRVDSDLKERGLGTTKFGEALRADAQVLRHWPGGKGIVYYGTGAGMAQRDDRDWTFAIGSVPARTWAVLVPCNDGNFFCPNPAEVDPYPMHFAAAFEGRFLRTLSRAEIHEALMNAASALTGPKVYELSWRDLPAPPKPASLTLVDHQAGGSGQAQPPEQDADQFAPAVSLVLDASGSMLKRLNGTRRIAIAKDSLHRLVEQVIPEQAQVSLRVFGLARDGCLTRQLSPLAPLNRPALKSAIDQIQAINLAKTPIAASLTAAAQDLSQAGPARTIILLTDGEETCDGSVDQALDALSENGIQATLHIVGFAIDDAALAADFRRWAGRMGGNYFAANDPQALDEAVSQAVALAVAQPLPKSAQLIPLDQGSAPETIAFGSSRSLAPGRYALRLEDGRALEVTLQPGEALSVSLADFGQD
jgi:hypothetical protein